MRIAHIITGLEVGGAESFLSRLLVPLSSRHSCEVISLTTRGHFASRIEASGTPVHTLGMTAASAPVKLIELVRYLRRSRPDVVHTWMYHADLLGGVAARLAGVPAVFWNVRLTKLAAEHNKRSTIQVARASALLSKVVPDKIVCCATAARDSHIKMGYDARKMIVIPNGIDTERFRPDSNARRACRATIGATDHTPVVGMVGRFNPQKNYRGFFEMAAAVLKRHPETIFVLAGPGVEESNPTIRAWMAEFDLSSHIRLLGVRSDLELVLPGLDVFVSSSHDEGFPNAVAEAMACGVPAVVTDAGDSAHVVGATGICVPVNDPDKLCSALDNLLGEGDELTARGASARLRIIREFSLANAASSYVSLYESGCHDDMAQRAEA
ncbi:glycosyltransferase [Methylobacterium durans]|uniref:glycosyltransferase family 4 protein n=1 Tax=Methylobacterium durans TaxID=2202825 RepID=UPI002AFE5648|nr:glycosyltransferase [Methylobacterium durans]MEA1830882.1 glycosyltransferase [Methylobacterium durans]